jgi:hypothetical protein
MLSQQTEKSFTFLTGLPRSLSGGWHMKSPEVSKQLVKNCLNLEKNNN